MRLLLSLPFTIYAILVPPAPTARDPPERIALYERQRRIGNPILDRRMRRMGDVLSILSLVLFGYGNFWIITSKTCRATAPTLWGSGVAALVLSWVYSLEVILICVAVLFFLPFLLVSMRFFGGMEKKNGVKAMQEKEIDKIPLRIFV